MAIKRMKTLQILCLIGIVLSLPYSVAATERLEAVSPARCMPAVEDFSYMWWAHGLRGRSPEGRRVRCIRTGRYGLAFDVESVELLHLGPIATRRTYGQALTESNEAVFDLPPARLDLQIEQAGTVYRCTGSAVRRQGTPAARLIESGRFVQRCDIVGLEFADDRGTRLNTTGRLEIVAWPDRLALLLEVEPAEDWNQATATIRLTYDGREISAVTPSLPGDAWKAGQKRSATIILCEHKGTVPFSLRENRDSPQVVPGRLRLSTPPQEIAPVEVTAGADARNVTYDPLRGCFRVDLDRIVPQGEHNDALERVKLTLSNPGPNQQIVRLALEKTRGGFAVRGISPITGLSPMLRDAAGHPLGIPVQISKNWHTKRDLHLPYHGVWFHGYTLLRLPPRSRTECEFTLAYAHWGGVPAVSHAQLCLIGWGSNQRWEQSAIGSWGESICYEPDQGQVGGTVLDTRPLMVWAMKQDRPRKWGWTNNVGGADFLVYYDADGKKQSNARMRAMHRRIGPNLTEVTYAGQSADGKIDLQATVGIARSDDVLRGLYRFRYDVRRTVEFSRLVLFQAGGDHYSYTGERKFARGNEQGLIEQWETQWGGNRYKTPPTECTGRIPWFSMHEAVSRDPSPAGAWANRGIILRHWDARLGGKPAPPYAAERGAKVRGTDTSLIDVLPPPGLSRLEPGDYVEAEVVHLVVPQRAADYYGPNENLRAALAQHADTWKMVYREAIGNDLHVTARNGRVLRRYSIVVEVDKSQSADFTVAGGIGHVPITLEGLTRHNGYALAEIRDGRPHVVDQSVHGHDFWQTDYDPATGRFSRTYNVSLDGPGDRRRQVRFVFR